MQFEQLQIKQQFKNRKAADKKWRKMKWYNLYRILSVIYGVNAINTNQFRQWAIAINYPINFKLAA